MTTPALTLAPTRSKALPVILGSGVIAGVLDITYVIVLVSLRGASPARMLQGIAYSILGSSTYDGGNATVALGLGLHFCVALAVAAVFYALSRKATFLVRHPFVWGPIYGTAVHVLMSFVIVPLTLIPRREFNLEGFLIILVPHLVCVGLPIALIVRRFAR